jgi:2-aminophenol/2-amino-5-chlorophenol 1,6-dioxygenase subunit alpha
MAKKKPVQKPMKKKMSLKVATKNQNPVKKGFVVTGLPHILLCPQKNPGWQRLAQSMQKVRDEIAAIKPDVILLYSTYWSSVIGHQIQADPKPKWTLVDDLFHDLGSIPYELKMDAKFAKHYADIANTRGLHARTVAYKGFPIDSGSVVALKLINPDNRFPAVIVSSNVYADRAETVVLGKTARETLLKENKTAVAIVVTSLSNRLFDLDFDPKQDRIHSRKDDEWNRKVLEYLALGRLEDVSQLSRQIHKEARVNKVNNFKPFWWLSALMGQNNLYKGDVMSYEAVQGTGAVVCGLTPSARAARDLEYDEEDPEMYLGERNVLGGDQGHGFRELS